MSHLLCCSYIPAYGAFAAAGFSSPTSLISGCRLFISNSVSSGCWLFIANSLISGCWLIVSKSLSSGCWLLISKLFFLRVLLSISNSPAPGFWLLISSFMLAHCAGHDAVQKVTLIPRGQARGLTWFIPGEDPTLISKQQIFARIVGALGGRATEQVVFGDAEVTTGASSDLQQVCASVPSFAGCVLCSVLARLLGVSLYLLHCNHRCLSKTAAQMDFTCCCASSSDLACWVRTQGCESCSKNPCKHVAS